PPKLAFHLGPGSRLDFVIVHVDGTPAGSGTYILEGPSDSGFLPSWTGVRLQRRGSFSAGAFALESLPPVRVRLIVRMASGEKIDVELELAAGKNEHKVVL